MAEWIVRHERFLEIESVSFTLKHPALTLVVLSSPQNHCTYFSLLWNGWAWIVFEKIVSLVCRIFFSIFSSLSCLSLSTSLFYPMSHFFTVWSSFKNILTDIIYKNVVLLKTLMNETIAL